ncbi:MAG: alpha/beta fold hydrolase [Alphaproteobacteria bacterium]
MAGDYRERAFHAQDDLQLSYRDYGDPLAARTPLLCLSGLTRNARDFERLAMRESARRRVICLDYRGRGRSRYDPDWRNYRPETYLADIRHLLVAANVHRVVAIGTSLGGILAMALGALLPTALAGVVLNDVGPEIVTSGLARILDYVGIDRPQPDWASATRHIHSMFPSLGLTSEEDWRRVTEGTYRLGDDGQLHFDWDVAIAKPIMKGKGATPPLWPLFRSLRNIPVLALRGELSDVLSLATFERMAVEKPDLVRVSVPGVGHTPSLEEPATRSALDAFLARL